MPSRPRRNRQCRLVSGAITRYTAESWGARNTVGRAAIPADCQSLDAGGLMCGRQNSRRRMTCMFLRIRLRLADRQ